MDLADHLFHLVVLALVIGFVVLGLRVFIRVRHKGAFGYDDVALCVAFISYILFCTFTFLYLGNGYGSLLTSSLDRRREAERFYFFCQLAGVFAAALIKTSVVIVLLRINVQRLIRYILLSTLTTFWIATLFLFFFLLYQCQPRSIIWDVGEGTCVSLIWDLWTWIVFSIADILYNWLYSLTPIAILWNVQMSTRAKVSLVLLLGMGVISSIATIVKCIVLTTSPFARHLAEQTSDTIESQLDMLLWTHVELSLALLATSLVALRPLLKYITKFSLRARGSGAGGNEKHKDPRELATTNPGGRGYDPTRLGGNSRGIRACSPNSQELPLINRGESIPNTQPGNIC